MVGDLTNTQYKPIWNWDNGSPPLYEYIPIKIFQKRKKEKADTENAET
jgi:hypothetical protein